MAYDPVKAHEYYVNYRKKGLKKGRKKGSGSSSKSTKKKSATTSLIGLSTSGLNDAGKMEAALVKDRLKKEMNTALSTAKTDEEKMAIRREYQNKALAEIQKIKANSQFATPKKEKAASTKSSSSGSKSSSGSSGRSTSKAATEPKASSSRSAGSTAATKVTAQAKKAKLAKIKSSIKSLSSSINSLNDRLADMSPAQRTAVKPVVQGLMNTLKKIEGVTG